MHVRRRRRAVPGALGHLGNLPAGHVGPGVDTGTDVAGRDVPEVPEGAGDSPPPPSDVHAVVTDVAMAAVASNAAA
ncbi:MAG: hypothetical protein QOC66_3663, partial [Pseudonocardiales bacterium]|nr:hypothetical protein [Pseudonocardiales bacterium]